MAAYTAADLQNIRGCISSGVLETRFADGRSVKYQNLDQLLAAERVIAAQIGAAAVSAGAVVRKKLASFRNGC